MPFRTLAQKTSQILRVNEIIEESKNLKKENLNLKTQLLQANFLEAENQVLKKQLKVEESKEINKLVLTRVVGFNQVLFIDNEKVISGLPVIAAGNLYVGETLGQGKVRLSTDPKFSTLAYIKDLNQEILVKGVFGTGLYATLPLSEKGLAIGQIVLFKKNLPLILGEISDIYEESDHISQRIEIKPFYQANSLEEVFIALNF